MNTTHDSLDEIRFMIESLNDYECIELSSSLSKEGIERFIFLSINQDRESLELYSNYKKLGLWSLLAEDLLDYVNMNCDPKGSLNKHYIKDVQEVIESILDRLFESGIEISQGLELIHLLKYLGCDSDYVRLFMNTSIHEPKNIKVLSNFITLSSKDSIYEFYVKGVKYGLFNRLNSWNQIKTLVMTRIVHLCHLDHLNVLYDLSSLTPREMSFLMELGYCDKSFIHMVYQRGVNIPHEFNHILEEVLFEKSVDYIESMEDAIKEWGTLNQGLKKVVYERLCGPLIDIGDLPMKVHELNIGLMKAGHKDLGLTGKPQ